MSRVASNVLADDRRGRWVAGLALGISLAIWLALSSPWRVSGRPFDLFDLAVYRGGAQLVLHGHSLYGTRIAGSSFTYPPLAALLFIPLALVSNGVAEALFSIASIAALVAIVRAALRLARVPDGPGRRVSLTLALAAAALWLEPVQTTLGYGQIDLVIAALVVCDLARDDGARTKGAMIGLAAGLKLTPAVFVVYLLLARRVRAGVCALAVCAGTVLIGFVVLPADAARYWGGAAFDTARVGRVQNTANQSLLGALMRALHSTDVHGLWLPLALGLGGAGLVVAARAARRGDEAGGFALCALTGLLVSPISWTHHWAIAVPALAVFAVRAARSRSRVALVSVGAIAAVAYSRVTWSVPRVDELRAGVAEWLAADAYVVIGLLALALTALAARGPAATTASDPPAGTRRRSRSHARARGGLSPRES